MRIILSWCTALCGLFAAALVSPGARAAPSLADEYAKVAGVSYTTTVAAAARSDTVSWVTTRAGAVALWVATGPRYEARRLLLLSGDTGDVIGDLALSPDGGTLAYTRGPSSAPNGRTPNPAALVGGLENALWLIDTQAGKPVKVALHADTPLFAPDSRRLVYLQAGQPQLIEIAATAHGLTLGAPRVLFKDLGDVGELAWSPDGNTLAFVSERAAHSLIGTYHLGDDRVRYIAPSVYRDLGVVWSLDGRKLAFLRLPGIASTDVADVMKDERFSVWVANLAGTEVSQIYRSPGADASLNTDGSLHWLKDGRVVFLSDADGYSHVYAVDPATRRAEQLTRGSCDEESLVVSASGDHLAASGNCDDAMRRQVAMWALEAQSWKRVSGAQSVATDPVFVGNSDALLFRSATYDRAQAPIVVVSTDRHVRLGNETAVADGTLQLPEVIQLKAADGTALSAVWFAPRHVARGHRAAAVVFVHGGPIRQMMPAWDLNPYYAYTYAANQVLARHGVGVLAINYRTGVGFGRAFRNAAHYGPGGASELQDVIAAGIYLRSRADVDSARIGIYGGSYGGHLTANALARRSDLFKAGVAWHGIYDFTQWITNVGHPDRRSTAWGASEATRALAFQSSALSQVGSWRSPTLLICGDDDRNVDFAETVTLYRALQEAKVPVDVFVIPNEVHAFLRFASWVSVVDRTGGFLLDHLAGTGAQ